MCKCLQESRYFNSLAELYSELNEQDVLCGLWKRRCCAPETRAAVGWMQHGYLDTAQEALLQAMSKFANKDYDGVTPYNITYKHLSPQHACCNSFYDLELNYHLTEFLLVMPLRMSCRELKP